MCELDFQDNLTSLSSRGGLEVEQWSDSRNLSILVDQILLETMNMYSLQTCVISISKLKD